MEFPHFYRDMYLQILEIVKESGKVNEPQIREKMPEIGDHGFLYLYNLELRGCLTREFSDGQSHFKITPRGEDYLEGILIS